MIRKQSLYFQDIKNAIESINRFIDGMSFDKFSSDDRTFSAIIRKIEIIGEAANNVSITVRTANPNIPWTEMTRMRDKLIHGYFGIDADIVWKTIKEDLPEIWPLISKLCLEHKD
jgi:uncharacterized protein with HEPN domain